jgi:hypothetical protein
MTCAPSDRLMQTLKVHVPGVTDPVLQLEIFNSMDEFFRRTNAWQHLNDIQLQEGQNLEYDFLLPADATVVRVLGVTHQGTPVPPTATGNMIVTGSIGVLEPQMTFPDGDASFLPHESDLANEVFSYTIYKPGYIQVIGSADETARSYPLQVALALSVTQGCLECECGDWQVPEWMWEMYFQDWLDGTLARCYGMPAKPWSNAALAAFHGKRWRNRMAFRKQETNRGFVYNTPGWRFSRASGWV